MWLQVVPCSHKYELFAVKDNSKTAKFCVQTMLEKLFFCS